MTIFFGGRAQRPCPSIEDDQYIEHSGQHCIERTDLKEFSHPVVPDGKLIGAELTQRWLVEEVVCMDVGVVLHEQVGILLRHILALRERRRHKNTRQQRLSGSAVELQRLNESWQGHNAHARLANERPARFARLPRGIHNFTVSQPLPHKERRQNSRHAKAPLVRAALIQLPQTGQAPRENRG